MEYRRKFEHTLGRMQHIALMSRIYLCYRTCRLATQTVAPTFPGYQGIKRCVQYRTSKPHKPIFCPYNYNGGSNFIILAWSGNQVEEYTTQNCI